MKVSRYLSLFAIGFLLSLSLAQEPASAQSATIDDDLQVIDDTTTALQDVTTGMVSVAVAPMGISAAGRIFRRVILGTI